MVLVECGLSDTRREGWDDDECRVSVTAMVGKVNVERQHRKIEAPLAVATGYSRLRTDETL